MSLIDPDYELVDPCPDLHSTFLQFNKQFFEEKLITCEVVWSKRMTKCAGLCHFQRRSGYCSIRLSEPLLKLRPRKDFVETLLHEMIHAFLFLTSKTMDRDGHGPNFQFHMHRINKIAGTNITIYHSFHAEVRLYQQHWWRCDGKCREMRPFYGWVKRAMNRAPSKNDRWWTRHEEMCGGKFIKVKEPEPTATKGKKRKSPEVSKTPTLDTFFPGKGQILGGKVEDEVKKPTKVREHKTPVKSPKKTPVKPPAVRFPGGGHRLGGDTSPDKKSRLITDFMPKIEKGAVPKTPENAAKIPQPSVLQSPPLIQLEHDDFGWDDEEVQILDFDDMVAVHEEKQNRSKSGTSSRKEIFVVSSNEPKPGPSRIKQENDIEIIDEKIRVIGVENISLETANPVEELVDCPGCTKRMPLREINGHLDFCVI